VKLHLLATVTLGAIALSFPAAAENLSHVQRLLSENECPNCDLSSAGLTYSRLAGANLQGANLVRANLSQADLTGADLRGANLTGASLSEAILIGADLRGANLTGVDMRWAYLTDVQLEDADLTGVNLRHARGIPADIVEPMQLFLWGNDEAERGNFPRAISYYNQALSLNSDLAAVYLARAISYNRMGDTNEALADANYAAELFFAEGDETGFQMSEQFIAAVEFDLEMDRERRENPGGNGNLMNVIGGLASLFLQGFF